MFSKAGRQLIDTACEAALITDVQNVGEYIGYLNNCMLVKSHLDTSLREALNTEIVLGTISTLKEALDWVHETYL